MNNIKFFGVRHLSPTSADNLVKYMNKLQPKVVLIEGPSDATELIKSVVQDNVLFPIAMLGYTNDMPVRSVLYPFAEYSPEYQAMLWAHKNNAKCEFIDLPTSVTTTRESDKEIVEAKIDYYNDLHHAYEYLAKSFGERNYDAFWESNFEQIEDLDEYIEKMSLVSTSMRELFEDKEAEVLKDNYEYNIKRERYMVRNIERFINEGYQETDILVVCGAYHLKGLKLVEPMSDQEFNDIPKRDTSTTLMPYSFYRLSSQSGYGAGNIAPAYYQMLWEHRLNNKLYEVPTLYTTKLVSDLRQKGFVTSTASAIETVNLAKTLASFKNHKYPTYEDIKDSAVTCVGGGNLSVIADSLVNLNVGTKVGYLSEGVSKTSIQSDFNRILKDLNIEKYKTLIPELLQLDLRENINVKSKEKAYMDLNRSIFFNKLEFLKIDFAKRINLSIDEAVWKEVWELSWTPEIEIQVVETILKGETIDSAVAFSIKEVLDRDIDINEVANIIKVAYNCNLLEVVKDTLVRLDELFIENDNFTDVCNTCITISDVIKYRDLRNIDTNQCIDIFIKLYNRSVLLLNNSANCDDSKGEEIITCISQLFSMTQHYSDILNYDLLLKEIEKIAFDDSKNTMISGVCFSLLMEKNKLSNEIISTEISKRLSLAVPVDLCANWFYGVCKRNRYALLSKVELWKGIGAYVDNLDDSEFKRAIVFLRRTFDQFSDYEKNGIVEVLADIWNISPIKVADALNMPLSEQESAVLEEIDDFDFEDLI